MKKNMNSNEKFISKVEEESINEYIKSNLPELEDKDLPEIITGQYSKLKELDKKTKNALKSAISAKNSSIKAKGQKVGWFNKKAAIEELQKSGMSLADAVVDVSKTLEISFEFQTKLAEISTYLFGLGASNIAINRFIVRELELRLKDASEEELSELARQELIAVVKQLKSQEDLHKKQEVFAKALKSYDEEFSLQSVKIQDIKGKFDSNIQVANTKIDNVEVKLDSELQVTNTKIDDIEKKLDSELQTANTKIDNVEVKLDSELQAANTKIDDVEKKLDSELQTVNTKIDNVEGKLNTDLDVAFSKLQAIEEKANSELTFSNVQIKKNRKRINLLIILLIVNFLVVVGLFFLFKIQ